MSQDARCGVGGAHAMSPGRSLRGSRPSLSACRLRFAILAALADKPGSMARAPPRDPTERLRRRMLAACSGLPMPCRPDVRYGPPGLRSLHAGCASPSMASLADKPGSTARAPPRDHRRTVSHEATRSTSGRRPAERKWQEAMFRGVDSPWMAFPA
jgi:hypothetical protein